MSDKNITRAREYRSTATPPMSRKTSIGVEVKMKMVLIAFAEPVFSRTHHASATR